MQVVILCGGKGTRMWPKTEDIPKPLVTIGDKPIIWHLMKIYSNYGHKDFVLALGYLGQKIKEYFLNPENKESDWNITFVDTGEKSSKGERMRRVKDYVRDEYFFTCFGDDLSDVNINTVLENHKKSGKIATLIAIKPISQFGVIDINENNEVEKFIEKPKLTHFINGGFYVFKKEIFEHIREGWDLEGETLEHLSKNKQVNAFKHDGFWVCMNTQKDVNDVNKLWESGELQNILHS